MIITFLYQANYHHPLYYISMERYRPQPEENRPEIEEKKEHVREKIGEIWQSLAHAKESDSRNKSLREYAQTDYLMDGKKVGFDFTYKYPQRVKAGIERAQKRSAKDGIYLDLDDEYVRDFYSGFAGITLAEPSEKGEMRRDVVISMEQGKLEYGVIDYVITNKTNNPPITPDGAYNLKCESWPIPNIQQPLSYYRDVFRYTKDSLNCPLPYQESPLRKFKKGEADEVAKIVKAMSSEIQGRGCYMGGGRTSSIGTAGRK